MTKKEFLNQAYKIGDQILVNNKCVFIKSVDFEYMTFKYLDFTFRNEREIYYKNVKFISQQNKSTIKL